MLLLKRGAISGTYMYVGDLFLILLYLQHRYDTFYKIKKIFTGS